MILWLCILLLLCVSFVFSGIEAGILSLNRVRLRNRVKHRDRNAMRLQRLLKNPGRLLLTVVVVTNLANICAIALATASLVRLCGRPGYAVAFALFLPLYLFGLELFPKALFRRFPTHALAFLSTPLRFVYLALAPVFKLGGGVTRKFLAPVKADASNLFVAREDFKYLTLESERTGAISSAQRRLIHGVVDFRAVTARELMRPLVDFPTIAPGATLEELVKASCGGSHEDFVVVDSDGSVLGVISLFEALLASSPDGRVSSYFRRALPIQAAEASFAVLRDLRTSRAQVGLVMDGEAPLGLLFPGPVCRRLVSGS
ncbi:MAG: CNNM domain-containing protein [Chthoniobacteraceae bacterium]